ncbi:MAG: HAD family hydrolase [Ruminococcaceae bacterium]|nr:HAD family hydrolase [Oscillospiraceae bacterium]
MSKYSLVIWDFNGTLIDDVSAALGAVNDMLTKRSQPQINLKKYYSAIDIPIWKFYETVFVPDTITPLEAIEEFEIGYEKHLKADPLMEGARNVLEYFSNLGVKQIVLSASHVNKVKERLQSLGIINYFDKVLGRSDDFVGDKTYLAKEYFSDMNIVPSEVLLIGDCVNDYEVSAALGCDCILTTKGHQSRCEFTNISALIVDELSEIISALE